MLITSVRHTQSDRACWEEYADLDRMHWPRLFGTPRYRRAFAAVAEFVAAGPCYCGVSWGKDSVVVANICRTVAPQVPLIHLRPTNHNPDCDLVRDAYFAAFPGQSYEEVPVDYGTIHAQGLAAADQDRATNTVWFRTIRLHGKRFEHRHILGIRAKESFHRQMRYWVHGENSRIGSAPISAWSTADVFAYLEAMRLPVHPVYGMLGGGRWQREKLRVAEIGDVRGGLKREQWEREYYGDVARRVLSGRSEQLRKIVRIDFDNTAIGSQESAQ